MKDFDMYALFGLVFLVACLMLGQAYDAVQHRHACLDKCASAECSGIKGVLR